MKREYVLVTLFFAISAAIFFLFYQLIIPFMVPICWAGVLVIIFFPLYLNLLGRMKNRSGLTSVLMCTLIVILIIGPITYLFVALVQEAATAIDWINDYYTSGRLDEIFNINIPLFEAFKERLAPYYDLSKINLDEIAKDAVSRVGGVIVKQTQWIVTNGTKAVFYFFLMLFAMFYFFRDGEIMIDKMKRLMPLSREQTNIAFRQLRDVIQATIYGGVVIALTQGALGGLLFLAVGIPSPVFWGAIMAFLSIIPVVGAFVVYLPAGIILMIGGSVVKGIVVILVGTVVISQVDNVIRPLLISGRTSLHPLLLFFTILGGIALFGLLGIVIGPLIAAGFTILLQVFEMRLHPDEPVPPAEVTE